MEQQIELLRASNGYASLILWIHPNGFKEYLVGHDYDETKPIGSRWTRGIYFRSDLLEAVEYWKSEAVK